MLLKCYFMSRNITLHRNVALLCYLMLCYLMLYRIVLFFFYVVSFSAIVMSCHMNHNPDTSYCKQAAVIC